MKKNLQLILVLTFIAFFSESMAQSTLLYYWNFNKLTVAGKNYGQNLLINSDSTTPVITAPGTLTWDLQSNDPNPSVDTINIADNVTGDTINARGSAKSTPAGSNWGLRPRDPSQYGQLIFTIPTTGFHNIVIKYECQASSIYPSAGIGLQLFDYSTDGGATFDSTGIVVSSPADNSAIALPTAPLFNEDSLSAAWGLVEVNLTAATAVNNSGNLIFRIRYAGANAIQSKTSGNDRFDNVTVEGTSTTTAITASTAIDAGYNVYPNPSADGQIYFTAPSASIKNITFYNTSGQSIYTTSVSGTTSGINVSNLIAGVYYVSINDNNTNYTLKFVKN